MFFNHDGVSVHYLQAGGGKPLLFLHGWGSEAKVFSALINRYKDRFLIIAPDFPPFGLSGSLNRDYTVSDYADMVYALAKSLGIEHANIICHSFGGRVAVKLATLYPDFIESIVFCGSAGIRKKKTLKSKIRYFLFRAAKFLNRHRLIGNSVLHRFYSKDYLALPPDMKKTFVNVINEDLSYDISLIKCPSLLIWGAKDKETPLYMARRYGELISGSKLHILKHCGHYAFLDNPLEFTRLTDNFFAENT